MSSGGRKLVTTVNRLLAGSNTRIATSRPATQYRTDGYEYMERCGFIRQSFSGGYYLLPMGARVLHKLVSVIDQEMRSVGACKMSAPILAPAYIWKQSGRWESIGAELYRLEDRHEAQFCLGPTHEEMFTHLVATENISYRSLPLRLYQIDRKFRDEMSPQSGLMRAKEFWMKDMYTFDVSESAAMETYNEVCGAYESVFHRLSLPVTKVKADQGTIGGSQSHEYHVISETAGMDTLYTCDKCGHAVNYEVTGDSATGSLPDCPLNEEKCPVSQYKGIEVAHAFFLGTTYSKKFTALYDKQKLCEMGCYGIGVSRLMQTIIEHSLAENNGKMIWPVSIAPMSVCITPLGNKKDTQLMSKAMDLYDKLDSRYPGEVVLDDRSQLSIGERVRHIELLGYPIAVVIGLKLQENQFELHLQSEKDKIVKVVQVDELIETIDNIVNNQ